jgi:ribonuclease HIII
MCETLLRTDSFFLFVKLDYVVAGYVVFREKVLLVFHPKFSAWYGIGGHIELHETPDQAMIREAKEEVNLTVKLIPQSIPVYGDLTLLTCALPIHTEVYKTPSALKYCLNYVCVTDSITELKFEEGLTGKWFSQIELVQSVDVGNDIKKQCFIALDVAQKYEVARKVTTQVETPKLKSDLQFYVVGSDESLKGDTFGGIVVAGVAVNDKTRETLRRLGVADSKSLVESRIFALAKHIKELCPHVVYSVYPKEYNSHTLTSLLNTLHAKTKISLSESVRVSKHIVDEYPGCSVGDIRETKAESKYIEVAAASILAREAALLQIRELSKRAGFTLPLGSTHVGTALLQLQKRKLDPSEFVKLHFKNVRAVLEKN